MKRYYVKGFILTIDPVGVAGAILSTGLIIYLIYSLEWWRIALVCLAAVIKIEGK